MTDVVGCYSSFMRRKRFRLGEETFVAETYTAHVSLHDLQQKEKLNQMKNGTLRLLQLIAYNINQFFLPVSKE